MRLNRNKLEGKVWGGFADAHPCPFGADSLTRIRKPLRGGFADAHPQSPAGRIR